LGSASIWQWTHPVEFGWFTYAPLSDTIFNPAVNTSRPLVLGYCLSVLGALGLGAGTGVYLIVRRGHR
jgi:heme/copper-type cytochrome/quinol oxidase subunit 1